MKNILSITACLKRCSVAVLYENSIYESNENTDASANLAYLAHKLVQSHSIDLKKIDGVITASGPGSFTGIRVAQSLAKGIALSLKIPSASVNYFDVMDNLSDNKQLNKIILIKSEKDQAYFKMIKSSDFPAELGVCSYEYLEKNIISKNDFMIISDIDLHNVSFLKTNEFIFDFRNAKHLLNFSQKITAASSITPLYINARA